MMGVAPVLVRVSERMAGAPSAIEPKLRLLGEICRCDCAPMPVRGTINGRVEAEVATLSVPVRVPDWVGMKTTCTVQLVPGASVRPGIGQVVVER